MSDVYPRYTARSLRSGKVVLRRVSAGAYDKFITGPRSEPVHVLDKHAQPPRFRIKIDPATTSGQPFVLADVSRPAYRGRFATLAAALAAMDDKVREERGRERYSRRHVNAPCTVEPLQASDMLRRIAGEIR